MQDLLASLKSVEHRVERAERRLWGLHISERPESDQGQRQLQSSQQITGTLSSGTLTERVHTIQRKLEALQPQEIQTFHQQVRDANQGVGGGLFGEYPAIAALPRRTQHEYLLSSEDSVTRTVEHLNQIKNDADVVLDSEPIHDTPSLERQLNDAEVYEMKLQRTADLVRRKSNKLLQCYYEFMAILSKKFALWEAQLDEIERKMGQ